MQLWQMDIVGGVMLVDTVTGELTEAKVVTGVDDHSRFCVIASVVERATGRAVCAAFAGALQRFGVPEEVLTDNGKQFTDRFGHGGEVLFDRICRENGIAHRLTQPASPTTTGKVERFHQTLRRELLDDCGAFESIGAAQPALDAWVEEYNSSRPHQALDMDSPADRFTPVPEQERDVLGLRVPGVLALVPQQRTPPAEPDPVEVASVPAGLPELAPAAVPVEPGGVRASGACEWESAGRGQTGLAGACPLRPDGDLLCRHLGDPSADRRSTDQDRALAPVGGGSGPAGRPGWTCRGTGPASADDGAAFEVDRVVNNSGLVGLGGHQVLAAEILGGRQVGIRIDDKTLSFFDLSSRELLRVLPNPLTSKEIRRLRGLRPAGPPPRPAVEPVRVQRRVSTVGTVMVCRQVVSLGTRTQGRS
jgi:hypothetical protein